MSLFEKYYNYFDTHDYTLTTYQKQPFKCPVCNGVGSLPANFYTRSSTSSSCNDVICKTCNGKGIVWRD